MSSSNQVKPVVPVSQELVAQIAALLSAGQNPSSLVDTSLVVDSLSSLVEPVVLLDPCLPLTADGPLRTHPEDCVKDNSSEHNSSSEEDNSHQETSYKPSEGSQAVEMEVSVHAGSTTASGVNDLVTNVKDFDYSIGCECFIWSNAPLLLFFLRFLFYLCTHPILS